jgi:SpoVK/Ycf46/Vps4 family AAA+-type ATPase
MLDLGALMGGIVGQTETAVRQALKIADAMAPCVLFLDEIEKGFAGTGTDTSGVTTRMFGSFLTWLNDHTTDVFVISTSNNIKALPPEFSRAERFDGIFFVDLPSAEQRDAIWDIYEKVYKIGQDDKRPNSEGWTGAEIRACCRLAALLGCSLQDAALNVVPVSATAADAMEGLRQWASGRCLDADRPGIYNRTRTMPAEDGQRRQVARRKTDLE